MTDHQPLPDPAEVRSTLSEAGLHPEDALRSASVKINAALTEMRGAPLSAAAPVNDTKNQLWEISRDGQSALLSSRDGTWTISVGDGRPWVEPHWVGPSTTSGPSALVEFCNDILSGDPARQGAWLTRSPFPPGV
jgi:hypothetical protein